jgi:hypothetical protein
MTARGSTRLLLAAGLLALVALAAAHGHGHGHGHGHDRTLLREAEDSTPGNGNGNGVANGRVRCSTREVGEAEIAEVEEKIKPAKEKWKNLFPAEKNRRSLLQSQTRTIPVYWNGGARAAGRGRAAGYCLYYSTARL